MVGCGCLGSEKPGMAQWRISPVGHSRRCQLKGCVLTTWFYFVLDLIFWLKKMSFRWMQRFPFVSMENYIFRNTYGCFCKIFVSRTFYFVNRNLWMKIVILKFPLYIDTLKSETLICRWPISLTWLLTSLHHK